MTTNPASASGRTWAVSGSGRTFYPDDPAPDAIDIEDIANALARQCRYAGHLRFDWPEAVYSVAQHSVLVYYAVRACTDSAEARRAAILHDAPEAYVHDIIGPLKPHLPDYRRLEGRWIDAVSQRFGVALNPLPPIVKEVDARILLDEKQHVISPRSPLWEIECIALPLCIDIAPWAFTNAREQFLSICRQEGLV